jgi:hypothetical protein
VLIVVAERRQGHRRLAGVAVAQDQQAGGGHAFGQDLTTQDRGGLGLQSGVQRGKDALAAGGHGMFRTVLAKLVLASYIAFKP